MDKDFFKNRINQIFIAIGVIIVIGLSYNAFSTIQFLKTNIEKALAGGGENAQTLVRFEFEKLKQIGILNQ